MTDQQVLTKNILFGRVATAGEIADELARSKAMSKFRTGKAGNTLRRHDADLKLFASYLDTLGAAPAGNLASEPAAWVGITWGLIEGFIEWMLATGYSVGSVNVRLSTVKTYARVAARAGFLNAENYALIRSVAGFSRKAGIHVDEERRAAGVATRTGRKKALAVSISSDQAKRLKTFPDTPQGRRDALLMCLLLNHGLRCSEVAILQVSSFDLTNGELRFYRPKVDKEQTHRLTPETLRAARAYFAYDALPVGLLLRGSQKNGRLKNAGMSRQCITERVKTLGEAIGLPGLSAHDCRHYAATYWAKRKDVKELMDIFGWNSPAMAVRYIESARVIELD